MLVNKCYCQICGGQIHFLCQAQKIWYFTLLQFHNWPSPLMLNGCTASQETNKKEMARGRIFDGDNKKFEGFRIEIRRWFALILVKLNGHSKSTGDQMIFIYAILGTTVHFQQHVGVHARACVCEEHKRDFVIVWSKNRPSNDTGPNVVRQSHTGKHTHTREQTEIFHTNGTSGTKTILYTTKINTSTET